MKYLSQTEVVHVCPYCSYEQGTCGAYEIFTGESVEIRQECLKCGHLFAFSKELPKFPRWGRKVDENQELIEREQIEKSLQEELTFFAHWSQKLHECSERIEELEKLRDKLSVVTSKESKQITRTEETDSSERDT